MANIGNLPDEILDHIFGFLPVVDQQNAQLVCSRWYGQLQARRFLTGTVLQVTPGIMNSSEQTLLLLARQRKVFCMQLNDNGQPPTAAYVASVVQLLGICSSQLEEIRFFRCTSMTMRAAFIALKRMRRLQTIRLMSKPYASRVPAIRNFGLTPSMPVGFASVRCLDVRLTNASYAKLVKRLAHQLTSLTLRPFYKFLLLDCLNLPNLSALRKLTVKDFKPSVRAIRLQDLEGQCWRMLKQLETLNIVNSFLLRDVRVKLLQDLPSLKRLTLRHFCNQPEENAMSRLFDGQETLQLPNVEYLRLSTHHVLALNLPKLSTIFLEGRIKNTCVKAVMSEVTKIEGISGRMLQMLRFKYVTIDHEAVNMLATLSVQRLSFSKCRIDNSILDWLAKPETRARVCKINIASSSFIYQTPYRYEIRTIAALRAKCPYLQIASSI